MAKILGDAEDDTMCTEPKYYWGCCMVCGRGTTQLAPLKRCAGCSCVYYCSRDHQKQDWRRHKEICSYLSATADGSGADNFFAQDYKANTSHVHVYSEAKHAQNGKGSLLGEVETDLAKVEKLDDSTMEDFKSWKAWNQFRVDAIRVCQETLDRDLCQHEKELFLFPRVCRVCRSAQISPNMIDCFWCLGVTYCCKEHQQQDEIHHKKLCSELRYAMVCDNYEQSICISAPPIPAQLDEKYLHKLTVGCDIRNHIETYRTSTILDKQKRGDIDYLEEQKVDLIEMELRFLSDRLTGPLTILYVAQLCRLAKRLCIGTAKEIVIHIVGSNIVEMLGIIKWEYLAHRLPKLESLRLVFVGPELADHEEEDGVASALESANWSLGVCDNCANQGRAIHYEIRRRLYHDYAISSDYTVPDLVCAFNCGFHEYESSISEPWRGISEEGDTWAISLPYLVRHSNVPLVFTSYTKTEADKDLYAFKKAIQKHEQELHGTDKLLVRTNQVNIEVETQENPFRSLRPIRNYEFDNNCDTFYYNQFLTVVRKFDL